MDPALSSALDSGRVMSSAERHDPSVPVLGPSSPRVDLVLRPRRSLSPAGFALLMAAVGLTSFVAGLWFWIAGAWPVVGFLGLDVLLIWAAFKLNYRAARRYETVRLTDDALTVEQVCPRGRISRWSAAPPSWLRVVLVGAVDEPEAPQHLLVSSHGRTLEVGAFLSPIERLEVAAILRTALDRQRRPQHLR